MLPRNHPDRIQIAFDDHRLVANAGLLLPVTLAHHLGLSQLVQERLDLGNAPGRANTGHLLNFEKILLSRKMAEIRAKRRQEGAPVNLG